MKKYAIPFLFALTIMIICHLISDFIYEIPDFFIGWISCTGWEIGKKLLK